MEVLPVRYEQLESGGYLVGAKILSVNEADHPVFDDLMESLGARRQIAGNKPLAAAPKMAPKAPLFGFMSRIL